MTAVNKYLAREVSSLYFQSAYKTTVSRNTLHDNIGRIVRLNNITTSLGSVSLTFLQLLSRHLSLVSHVSFTSRHLSCLTSPLTIDPTTIDPALCLYRATVPYLVYNPHINNRNRHISHQVVHYNTELPTLVFTQYVCV